LHEEIGTGIPKDLLACCDELYEIAQRFAKGTQITNPEEARKAGQEAGRLLFLVEYAKANGATPYEIECAMKGELILLA
jgi:hypothetical protein